MKYKLRKVDKSRTVRLAPAEILKSFLTCQSFGLILKILSVRTIKYAAEILFFVSPNEILPVKSFGLTFFDKYGEQRYAIAMMIRHGIIIYSST